MRQFRKEKITFIISRSKWANETVTRWNENIEIEWLISASETFGWWRPWASDLTEAIGITQMKKKLAHASLQREKRLPPSRLRKPLLDVFSGIVAQVVMSATNIATLSNPFEHLYWKLEIIKPNWSDRFNIGRSRHTDSNSPRFYSKKNNNK